jgi:hypothetical protein
MRDGIYKNLPLSKPCRAFWKSCTLDAERGEIAREKFERAASAELRAIQPQFRSAFRERIELTESLLPMVRVFDGNVTSRDLRGQNLPLENEIVAAARHLEESGLKGPELERQAYARGLREIMNAQHRLVEQTILNTGSDADSKATIGAARNAKGSAKIMPIIDGFVEGRSVDLPPARRPVDLNEDLSRTSYESE